MMNNVKLEFDADVSKLTTFGVPARAAAVARWRNVNDLQAIIRRTDLPRPLKAIGGGSNLLFTKPFEGTLLVREGEAAIAIDSENLTLEVDSHALLDDVCALTADKNFRGFENLSGIPGQIGGALVQNAGAYGAEIGELLEEMTLIDLENGELSTHGREWMEYSYRASKLKAEPNSYVIIKATFRLRPGTDAANLDYGNLRQTLGDTEATPAAVRRAVLATRSSKLPDPSEVGSAGSFFRNPEVTESALTDDMPRYDLGNGLYKVPAAWLIDHAGLKSASRGCASTWPTQPLVIVNTNGQATAGDVIELEQKIIGAVKERYGITLIPEVEHL